MEGPRQTGPSVNNAWLWILPTSYKEGYDEKPYVALARGSQGIGC